MLPSANHSVGFPFPCCGCRAPLPATRDRGQDPLLPWQQPTLGSWLQGRDCPVVQVISHLLFTRIGYLFWNAVLLRRNGEAGWQQVQAALLEWPGVETPSTSSLWVTGESFSLYGALLADQFSTSRHLNSGHARPSWATETGNIMQS